MNITYLFLFQMGGGLLSTFLMFGSLIAIFYFIVIRPQKQQQEKLKEMIAALKIGDEIVTNGGIIGKIIEVKETSFVIRSAEKSNLEIGKPAVVGKRNEETKN